MERKIFKGVFWLLLVCLLMVFGISTETQAKDFIQWKGVVFGIQPPDASGSVTTLKQDLPLAGATIRINQYPSVNTKSDASGNFILSGIPASQLHYFKVTKDTSGNKYIPTNIGAKVGDMDIDNVSCFSGSGGGTGGGPTCCPIGQTCPAYPGLPTCSEGGGGGEMTCCPVGAVECIAIHGLPVCPASGSSYTPLSTSLTESCPTGTTCQACPAGVQCPTGGPCATGQVCMSSAGLGTSAPPATCSFTEKLFAVSDGMKTFIENSFGYMGVDLSTKGMVMLRLSNTDGSALQINTTSALISVNGNERIPQGYAILGTGMLVIPNVPPGDATITIENIPNVTIPAITLPIFVGEITYYSVELLSSTSTGTITGKVTDANGTAIQGATVNAIAEGAGRGASAVTNLTGNYTLSLGQGMYKIRASAEGYAVQFFFETDRPDWASPMWVMPQGTTQDINFKLFTAKTIIGKVTDKATGSPIANAWVNAWSNTTQVSGGAPTDASGTYTISVKPASDYQVNAKVDGYAEQFYNNKKGPMDLEDTDFVDVTTANKEGIDFALEKGKKISGKVTDENSSPISNLRVDAFSDSTGSGGGDNTKEDGTYAITVGPASDYRVRSNPQCMTPSMGGTGTGGTGTPMMGKCYPEAFYGGPGKTAYQWDAAFFVDVTLTDAANIDIKLGSGRTISGTVTAADGSPAYGVQINAFSPMGGGSTETDASGNFAIGVAPGFGYRVEAFSDTYPRVMWKGRIECAAGACEGKDDATTTRWDDATMLDLASADIKGIDFVMSAGITVTGSVVDSDDKGLAGVWVNAWSDTENIGSGDQSKGDGSFSLKVPSGSGYRISANSPQFPNVFYKTSDPASCATDCSDLAPVAIYHEATVFNFTNADVQYTMPMMGPGATQGQTITLPKLPDGAKGVKIKYGSSGGSIEGIVKANGKPIAGVWINAYSEGCGYGVGEPSKTDGTYKMKVLAGGCTYKVEAFTEKFIRQFYNAKFDWMDADAVEVTDSSPNVKNINFNLSAGNSISGTVKTGSGTKLPGIWVNAFSQNAMMGGGAQTDPNGSYTIFVRPANDYKVSVWDPNYAPQTYNQKPDMMQGDPVDTTGGSRTGIDFTMNSGCEIVGKVTIDGTNAPAADTWGNRGWVNAFSDSSGAGAGGPVTDAQGNYRIKAQCATDYRVQVFHPKYAPVFYNGAQTPEDATLVDANVTTQSINFTLSSGGTIKGTISDANGGIQNVWVNAFSEKTRFGFGNSTDASGNYIIDGLPPGSGYKVSVSSPQFANVFYKEGAGNESGTANWTNATELDLTGGATKDGINIKLSAGGNIKGVIKVASGAFSGNIFVDAFSQSLMMGRGEPVKYNANDTSANFTIKGLPAATDYKVHVMAEKYGNKFYMDGDANGTVDWMLATPVTISGSDVTLNNAISLSTGASISGTIYTDSSKSADKVVRAGWIQAMNPDKGEYQGTPIKPDGTYDIKGLTAGNKYTVQAMPEGYTPVFYDSNATNSTTADWVAPNVPATEEGTKGIDMVASKGNTISGRVLESDGTTAVPYAFIGIYGCGTNVDDTTCNNDSDLDDNPFFWSPMSDGAGNYLSPPLPAGKYLLSAVAMKEGAMGTQGKDLGKAFYIDGTNKVLTLSGSDLTGKNIKFKGTTERGKISGTITNSSGSTMDEIQVMVFKYVADGSGKMVHSKSKATVTTGNTFAYEFEVDSGSYVVMALGHIAGGEKVSGGSTKKMFYNGQTTKLNATQVDVTTTTVSAIDITLSQ